MTREQFSQLVELAGVLYNEAGACANDKHWRAAAFLVAQSVEAGLVATVSCCEPELRALHAWPSGKKVGAPEHWMFGTLLRVAQTAGWLEPSLPEDTGPVDATSGGIGDAVRFLLEVRNLAAHPGRVITGGQLPAHDFTDDLLMARVYPALDGIAGAVFDRLNDVVLALRSVGRVTSLADNDRDSSLARPWLASLAALAKRGATASTVLPALAVAA